MANSCHNRAVARHPRSGAFGGRSLANIRIRAASLEDSVGLIYAVRKAVFIDEQGVPAEIEMDDLDPICRHVLAWRDGVAVGTGRITPDGRIGRMAVIASCRGQGIGRDILRELIRLGRDEGIDTLFLSAQCQAIPFYEKSGFVASGPVYKEAGINHRHMMLPARAADDDHESG